LNVNIEIYYIAKKKNTYVNVNKKGKEKNIIKHDKIIKGGKKMRII